MIIKKWFVDRVAENAKEYKMTLNTAPAGEETEEVAIMETLEEREKAIRVRIATGANGGSVKGYCTWVPRSVIVEG